MFIHLKCVRSFFLNIGRGMMSMGSGRGGRVPRPEKPPRYAYDVEELKRAA
jgi:hypothetical protein